jgi:hypothetical protein
VSLCRATFISGKVIQVLWSFCESVIGFQERLYRATFTEMYGELEQISCTQFKFFSLVMNACMEN